MGNKSPSPSIAGADKPRLGCWAKTRLAFRRCCAGCRRFWRGLCHCRLCGGCRGCCARLKQTRPCRRCRACLRHCGRFCCRLFYRMGCKGKKVKNNWRAKPLCSIPCERFWTCNWCCGCWTFTARDYDRSQAEPPHQFPPNKPAPKITRREEHIEYIKTRPRRGRKHKTDSNLKSSENETEVYTVLKCDDKTDVQTNKCDKNETEDHAASKSTTENETEVYFCTIKSSFNPKGWHPPLIQAKYQTTGSTERKSEEDSQIFQSKSASLRSAGLIRKRDKGHSKPADLQRSSAATTNCDSSCQYSASAASNPSLEIKTHLLTKSVSQLSSIRSVFRMKWRRTRRYTKQQNILQNIISKLTYKMNGKRKLLSARKPAKKNVLVLHVPKNFSSTSTDRTRSAPRPLSLEKPLVIKDVSSRTLIERSANSPKKLYGPGETLFQRNTYQNLL